MGYNLVGAKTGIEPLPSDRYTLKVESTKVEPHEKNGVQGHRIEITFKIASGDYENRKVWDNVYLPGAVWKAREILEALNSDIINKDDVDANDIANAMVGKQLTAYVESNRVDNNGTEVVRTTVKSYKPTDENPMFQ